MISFPSCFTTQLKKNMFFSYNVEMRLCFNCIQLQFFFFFVLFFSRLCEYLWRSKDNDRRMKLAELLLHQLLKLAFPLLLQMVGKIDSPISLQFCRQRVYSVPDECAHTAYISFYFRVWACPVEDVCSTYRVLKACLTRLQPYDRGWTDCLRSADVHAGTRSRLNMDFEYSEFPSPEN